MMTLPGCFHACLQVYLGQLALNLLWYVIFFDAKQPRAAQLENAGGCVTVSDGAERQQQVGKRKRLRRGWP